MKILKKSITFRCSEDVRKLLIDVVAKTTGNLSFWIEGAIKEKLERDTKK